MPPEDDAFGDEDLEEELPLLLLLLLGPPPDDAFGDELEEEAVEELVPAAFEADRDDPCITSARALLRRFASLIESTLSTAHKFGTPKTKARALLL